MGSNERGQATVELALCLPFVVVLAAIVVQIGMVAGAQVRVWHAAREGARAAAVDDDFEQIRAAAARAGLEPMRIEIEPPASDRIQGGPVTVTVSHAPAGRLPVVGRVLEGFVLEGAATMRVEVP